MTQNYSLERSPIANISLASKELFHSNFLAWAFNTYPTTLNAILDCAGLSARSSDESVEVTREEQNLDLVVRIGGSRLVVIENKLKSLPYSEQLRRYEEKAGKLDSGREDPEFVLLTLTSDDCDRIPLSLGRWECVDYGTLTKSLLDYIPDNADAYHREIVRDYAQFVGELVRIANDESRHVWNRAGSKIDGEALPAWLTKHKLHDLFGKRQGQIVAAKVYEEVTRNFANTVHWQHSPKDVGSHQITIYSGFTNSQPLVGVFYALGGLPCPAVDEAPPVGVGFQVQGDQFRSYVEWPKPGRLAQKPVGRDLPSKTAAIAWDLFCDERCPESFWTPKQKSGAEKQNADSGKTKSRYKEQCRFGAPFQYRYRPLSKGGDTRVALNALAETLAERTIALLNDLKRIESLLQEHQSNYLA
ncbi:MAG: PD-(D/E)XK nuclease family protein [Xanthomonadales bacterium]|nr:PD-(D/E)XK nuclease family protein [Xanthomonadales bacterium]